MIFDSRPARGLEPGRPRVPGLGHRRPKEAPGLIQDIPHHLRNTVERLDLPIHLDLSPSECHPPEGLALGDTLMLLGLIRNQGRPLRMYMDPGPTRPLLEGHPLVRELLPPGQPSQRFKLHRVPVGRAG
ncbi:MAG: hypothetical protein HY910_00100 [Desulfarculus sp.]|nr:hypothetical protein [Desulfarculus sp.]